MGHTGGSFLHRFFRFRENATTLRTEIAAGLTTFAAMAYILAVNPRILSASGMDFGAVVTATALASAIMTAVFGLVTNWPIALAPGMGLNAFFTFTICLGMKIPWQAALAMVFLSGVGFLLLSLSGARRRIVEAIPRELKIAISCGIGLFIADACAAMVGSSLGTSTVTSYIESAAGAEEGGRTGLTALTVSACFLGALFFHPFLRIIPVEATAPALVVVGVLMMQSVMELDLRDFAKAVPAVLTIALMPLTFSISEGLAIGFVIYAAFQLGIGRAREISGTAWVLAALFLLHLVFR